MAEETITSADQLDAMLLDGQISQEQYDELRQALEPPPSRPEYAAPTYEAGSQRRLHKSWATRLLGGVCGGLANYLGVSPDLVRILAIMAFCVAPPLTLIAYLVCYFSLPWDDPSAAREPQEKGHPFLFAGVLTVIWFVQLLFVAYIAPHIFALFAQIDLELPAYTRFLFSAYRVANSSFGFYCQIILISVLIGVYLVIHKPALRRAYAAIVVVLFLFYLLACVMACLLPYLSLGSSL